MKVEFKRNVRKWSALIIAIGCYFLIHEGAHFIYAFGIGAFKQINFIGLGIQVDVHRQLMSNTQMGVLVLPLQLSLHIFCLR